MAAANTGVLLDHNGRPTSRTSSPHFTSVTDTLHDVFQLEQSFQLCPQRMTVPPQLIKQELPCSPADGTFFELTRQCTPTMEHALVSPPSQGSLHGSDSSLMHSDGNSLPGTLNSSASWESESSGSPHNFAINSNCSSLPEFTTNVVTASSSNFVFTPSAMISNGNNGEMVPELFNHGSVSKSEQAGGKMKPKRKRVINRDQRSAANVRERRRMVTLNDAFNILKHRIPTFSHEKKLSRIETLRLAIAYISFMKQLVSGKEPHDVTVDLPYLFPDSKHEMFKNPTDYDTVPTSESNGLNSVDTSTYYMDQSLMAMHQGYYHSSSAHQHNMPQQ